MHAQEILESERTLNQDEPVKFAPDTLELQVSPILVLRLLVALILVLVLVGILANYLIYHVASHSDAPLADVARRFDLGNEPSLPNWYSSLALLGAAMLLALIAVCEHRAGRPQVNRWAGMAVLFLVLAIDEAVQLHELVDGLMALIFDLHGIFFFGWVIPGMLFVMGLGIYYWRFVWQLPAKTRNLFLLAALLFVLGAIGMEMIAGVIIEGQGVESIWHTWSQAVEELLEMLGVAVFLYALIGYLGQYVGAIQIRLLRTDVSHGTNHLSHSHTIESEQRVNERRHAGTAE